MKRVLHSRLRERADLFGLVLASQGIFFDLEEHRDGFDLFVEDEDYDSARAAIRLYLKENRQSSRASNPFVERFHRTYSGLFAAVLILVVHTQLPPGQARQSVMEQYGASASAILDGDLYRLATALFLHVDDIHLAGNMGGLILFGTSVVSLTGTGLGWFLILLSGILGNGMNALFYKTQHLSVGASTAIFGAIGILAGFRCLQMFKEKGAHISVVMPIGAGLALLAFMGAGERSDVTAHLFGYLAGLLCGAVYVRSVRFRPSEPIQILFLVLTALVLGLCWRP